MMPVEKLTLIRPTQWHSYRHIKHRQKDGKSGSNSAQIV